LEPSLAEEIEHSHCFTRDPLSNAKSEDQTKVSNLPEQAGRLALFGPPPLIKGENSADYDELLAHISGAVKPSDVLEEIWVRDVVDLVWEALRLRRLKASLLAANVSEGLKKVLESFMNNYGKRESLAACWVMRQRSAVRQVGLLPVPQTPS
jgi:hypothetical protein